jgi:hypothetical protein
MLDDELNIVYDKQEEEEEEEEYEDEVRLILNSNTQITNTQLTNTNTPNTPVNNRIYHFSNSYESSLRKFF